MIVVSNTAAIPVTADVFLDFLGKRHTSAPLTFQPYETKPLSIAALLAGLNGSPSQAPDGGISIIPRGPQPSLIAQGRIADPLGGFSTGLSLHDAAHQQASALHANGVPIGAPSLDSPYALMGTFVPHVIVRNLQATPQSVTLTVEYPGAEGTEQVALPPLTLAGYTSQETTLESVMGALPLPLAFCSVRIQHDGPPGSVIAVVSSLEISGNSAVDSPVANEGDGWAGAGAHAWRLDAHTESVLFLTNESEKECPIAVQVHANGVAYQVSDVSLKPRETRAIDLRRLRDAQQADWQGHKIPAGATDGIVVWSRLAQLPVMGQMEVVEPTEAMASPDYEGGDGCPDCYAGSVMVPAQVTLVPTHQSTFHVEGDFQDCNGDDSYSVVSGGSWWSWNTAVATVGTQGQATGVSGGSTTIEDDFSAQSCDPCGPCDCYYDDDSGYGTANVITISGPNTVWWFNGYAPSGYAATIQLTAQPPSGSRQWNVVSGPINIANNTAQVATIQGTGLSQTSGDAKVTVTINGVTSSQFAITVRGPKLLVPNGITDVSDPTYAYLSTMGYIIQDNFSQSMPSNVPLNESWTTPASYDYTGANWRQPAPGGTTSQGAGFVDNIYGEASTMTPTPQSPPPLISTKVQHWGQDWRVGTTGIGAGARVQKDVIQKYISYARHNSIVTPAP